MHHRMTCHSCCGPHPPHHLALFHQKQQAFFLAAHMCWRLLGVKGLLNSPPHLDSSFRMLAATVQRSTRQAVFIIARPHLLPVHHAACRAHVRTWVLACGGQGTRPQQGRCHVARWQICKHMQHRVMYCSLQLLVLQSWAWQHWGRWTQLLLPGCTVSQQQLWMA